MARTVCFISCDGMVATCVNEVDGDCHHCNHNPEQHFDWMKTIRSADTKMTDIHNLPEHEKMGVFIGELEAAYIRGYSVTIVMPDGKLTIDWSVIPEIHRMMTEEKQKEVSHVALAHARLALEYSRSKRRVPFEYQSLTEEEYFQMRRGWQESKQRNREVRYERNERSFFGYEAELLNRVNERRYRRDHERH